MAKNYLEKYTHYYERWAGNQKVWVSLFLSFKCFICFIFGSFIYFGFSEWWMMITLYMLELVPCFFILLILLKIEVVSTFVKLELLTTALFWHENLSSSCWHLMFLIKTNLHASPVANCWQIFYMEIVFSTNFCIIDVSERSSFPLTGYLIIYFHGPALSF